MKRRTFLAGLFHETRTFPQGLTTLDDFPFRRGQALFEAEGDGSPTAGFLEAAREKDWDVAPLVEFRAMPGPTVAATASYTVDTPGPCSSNLQRFPLRHIHRPISPLDP